MGYRSAGGLLLLTLMYLLISPYLRSIPKRVTPFILLMAVFISFAVSLQMIDKIGRLEEKKSLLVKQRSQMGTFGLILGGRPELYTAALAIWDSPVFGHGSWARDKNYVYHLLDLRQYGYNINVTEDKIKDEYIPSHSYLLGAWVEAGIAGAVFWLAMLFLVARTLIDMTYVNSMLSALIIFKLCDFTWNILFSPFGIAGRFDAAFVIILITMVYHGMNREQGLLTDG